MQTARKVYLDCSVVVVDDNRHVLSIIRSALRGIGVRTAKAFESVEAAFQFCEASRPDLILTDWEMQPISGIDFVRMIRQHRDAQIKRIPIVMITSHASERHVTEARDAGVTEFIVKPITFRAIAERVLSSLGNPRIHIRTPDYTGPDRRRSARPNSGPERRRPSASIFPGLEGLSVHQLSTLDADTVRDLLAQWHSSEASFGSLIRRFESGLPAIVSRMREDLDLARRDVAGRRGHLGRIYRSLHDLKGQGSVFDFPLVSQIAELACRLIDAARDPDDERLSVLDSHLESIDVVARNNVRGSGGATGRAIIDRLKDLGAIAQSQEESGQDA